VDEHPPAEPVLLLEGGDLSTSTEFLEQLHRQGKDVAFRSIEDIVIRLNNGAVRMTDAVSGRDLSGFASVHMLSYPRGAAVLLNAIADYLHVQNVQAVNVTGLDAPTKLYKYVRLANRGVPVPETRARQSRPARWSAPKIPDRGSNMISVWDGDVHGTAEAVLFAGVSR
jgi:hypothetical protein